MVDGRILKPLVLALSAAWLGGCDSNAMPVERAALAAHPAQQRTLVDAGRGRIWTLTREGLSLQHIVSTERRAFVLPGWIMAGLPYGGGPTLVMGPGGDVLVASDVLPVIWRIDPRSLSVSVHPIELDAHHDKDVGFTSLVYSPRDGAFVATSTVPHARWRINAALTQARLQ